MSDAARQGKQRPNEPAARHPATIPNKASPHPATVAQRRQLPFGAPQAPPPHAATVAQRRASPPAAAVVQRYKAVQGDREMTYSDDEELYVRDVHELYASPECVEHANKRLSEVNSFIRLVIDKNQTSWLLPKLHRVHPMINTERVADALPGSMNKFLVAVHDSEVLVKTSSDCHVTSQMVMGSDDSQGGTDLEVAVLWNTQTNRLEEVKATPTHLWDRPPGADNLIGLRLRDAVLKKLQTGNYQIALPEVGMGLTQVNHPVERIQAIKEGKDKWNYHWAGVILESKTDYVVIENFAVDSGITGFNEQWRFRMHSKVKLDQSFHVENKAGTFATATPITFAVKAVPVKKPKKKVVVL